MDKTCSLVVGRSLIFAGDSLGNCLKGSCSLVQSGQLGICVGTGMSRAGSSSEDPLHTLMHTQGLGPHVVGTRLPRSGSGWALTGHCSPGGFLLPV